MHFSGKVKTFFNAALILGMDLQHFFGRTGGCMEGE
jgi:hypothetical protein